ncbi:MAG: prolipoprotein diacylglyceryl transferase, partial [Planctomycetota bacterium]
MLQELFRIPGLDLPVYGYGLMLVLGVWTAIEIGRRLAERVGVNGDHFVTMGLLALAAGVVGARLSHVLENLDLYTRSDRSVWANLLAAVNIRGGGLTFYGGFLLATPTLIGYALWRKIPIRLGMDIVAPCLMIGLAFGRVGCLLNGCCWGQACDLPWAVQFPYGSPPYVGAFEDGDLKVFEDVPPALVGATEDGRPVLLDKATVQADPELASIASRQHTHGLHPTQLYSTINALLIAGVCLAFFTMRRSVGQNFAVMLVLYGIGRFCLELVRTEPAVAT